jgi:hypothetical protein
MRLSFFITSKIRNIRSILNTLDRAHDTEKKKEEKETKKVPAYEVILNRPKNGTNKLVATPKKESPVSNIFEEVFSKIKTIVKNIYADEKKVGAVIATVKSDVPDTIKAFQPFWASSLALYSALITAVDDKGLNIPVDSAAFTAAKAWFTSFHGISTIIETDYKNIAADFAPVPATSEPIIAPAPIAAVAKPV